MEKLSLKSNCHKCLVKTIIISFADLCRYEAGADVANVWIKEIYDDENTEGVILVDAHNTFSNMNRKIALHKLPILCPIISNYLQNSYDLEPRLFLIDEFELSSFEDTTQDDPMAIRVLSFGQIKKIKAFAKFRIFSTIFNCLFLILHCLCDLQWIKWLEIACFFDCLH